MTQTRRIAHIDMDAFFASCELSIYPELRGVPMVVGGGDRHQPRLGASGIREFSRLRDYVGRGVLTTATYEARALGVHSGMPTMKAAKLAPDAVLLPVNFALYRQHSALFKDAVRSICAEVQDIGIDEIYADITSLTGDSHTIAVQIKAAVSSAAGLTCSVGIAPNKLLAKLCSDLQKPNGITVLSAEDVPTRVWPLPVSKVNGIGPKATLKLATMAIHTVGDLAAADITVLQETFGPNYAEWLHQVAHGVDDRPLVTHSEPRSISRETTFDRNLHVKRDRDALSEVFTDLCSRLSDDLIRKGYRAHTIGIKLRFEDFKTVTRDLTLPRAIDDKRSMRQAASACLKRIPLDKTIRLLGVRASALVPASMPLDEGPAQGALDFGLSEP